MKIYKKIKQFFNKNNDKNNDKNHYEVSPSLNGTFSISWNNTIISTGWSSIEEALKHIPRNQKGVVTAFNSSGIMKSL
jgi:hypothetical protein